MELVIISAIRKQTVEQLKEGGIRVGELTPQQQRDLSKPSDVLHRDSGVSPLAHAASEHVSPELRSEHSRNLDRFLAAVDEYVAARARVAEQGGEVVLAHKSYLSETADWIGALTDEITRLSGEGLDTESFRVFDKAVEWLEAGCREAYRQFELAWKEWDADRDSAAKKERLAENTALLDACLSELDTVSRNSPVHLEIGEKMYDLQAKAAAKQP